MANILSLPVIRCPPSLLAMNLVVSLLLPGGCDALPLQLRSTIVPEKHIRFFHKIYSSYLIRDLALFQTLKSLQESPELSIILFVRFSEPVIAQLESSWRSQHIRFHDPSLCSSHHQFGPRSVPVPLTHI